MDGNWGWGGVWGTAWGVVRVGSGGRKIEKIRKFSKVVKALEICRKHVLVMFSEGFVIDITGV